MLLAGCDDATDSWFRVDDATFVETNKGACGVRYCSNDKLTFMIDNKEFRLISTISETDLLLKGQAVTIYYDKDLYIRRVELSVGEVKPKDKKNPYK